MSELVKESLVKDAYSKGLEEGIAKGLEKAKDIEASKQAPTAFQHSVTVKDPENKLSIILTAMGKAFVDDDKSERIDTFKDALVWAHAEPSMIMSDKEIAHVQSTKSVSISTFQLGGALIEQAYAPEIVKLLYNAAIFRQAKPNIRALVNGNLTFAKRVSGTAGTYLGETSVASLSAPTYSQFKLNAKKLRVQVPISNDSIRYGAGRIESDVQNDIMSSFAVQEDQTILVTGTGTSYTPASIVNSASFGTTNTMTASPTALTRATDITKLVKQLLKYNIPQQRYAWFLTPQVHFDLQNQYNTNMFLMNYSQELLNKGTLYGYPVFLTNSLNDGSDLTNSKTVTTSKVMLVDMGSCELGIGEEMTIRFELNGNYTSGGVAVIGSSTDESVFTAELQHDFILSRPEAAAILNGVTWGIS